MEENKNFFLENRKRFSELKLHSSTTENKKENLEKATLFTFLNKNCFKGLYRINKKGEFNVPFNNAKNPLICDSENLKFCSTLLQTISTSF